MSLDRAQRQRLIADLIRTKPMGSQEEVAAHLAGLGCAATQATVSRDLEQLGAVKVKRGGVLSYSLPDQLSESDWSAERLSRILREWVLGAELCGNLLVLRTPPGCAHMVGRAIDQAQLPEFGGTVAGDDTLFVAVRAGHGGERLLRHFGPLRGGEQ